MRTFNKVVAVLGLLLLFVLIPVVAAIPGEVLSLLRDALRGDVTLTAGARLVIVAVAVVLWVAVVVLLWLEFRPYRSGTIRVAAVEGGTALVQSRSVERRVEQALLSLASVQAAQARVEQTRGGVVAGLTIDTDEDVNVPDLTSSAIGQARYLLEKEVGASVARVNVSVRHVAPKQGRAARSAVPAQRAQAPAVQPIAAPPRPASHVTPPVAPPAIATSGPVAAGTPASPLTQQVVTPPVAFEAAAPVAPVVAESPAPQPPSAEAPRWPVASADGVVIPLPAREMAAEPEDAAAAAVEAPLAAPAEPTRDDMVGAVDQESGVVPDEDDAPYYEPQVPDWRAIDGDVESRHAESSSGDSATAEPSL